MIIFSWPTVEERMEENFCLIFSFILYNILGLNEPVNCISVENRTKWKSIRLKIRKKNTMIIYQKVKNRMHFSFSYNSRQELLLSAFSSAYVLCQHEP